MTGSSSKAGAMRLVATRQRKTENMLKKRNTPALARKSRIISHLVDSSREESEGSSGKMRELSRRPLLVWRISR